MSENHFSFGAVSPNVAMIKCDGEPLNIGEVVDCLNRMCDVIKEQKTIIDKLQKKLEEYEVEYSDEFLETVANINKISIEELKEMMNNDE